LDTTIALTLTLTPARLLADEIELVIPANSLSSRKDLFPENNE